VGGLGCVGNFHFSVS